MPSPIDPLDPNIHWLILAKPPYVTFQYLGKQGDLPPFYLDFTPDQVRALIRLLQDGIAVVERTPS